MIFVKIIEMVVFYSKFGLEESRSEKSELFKS